MSQYNIYVKKNHNKTKCTSNVGEITISKGLYKRANHSKIHISFPQRDTFMRFQTPARR